MINPFRLAAQAALGIAKLAFLAYFCLRAYRIRLSAVTTYGMYIHEFDPWFNYRATEYMAERGWHAFFHWFDYMSWYPVGRPIGTTTYPGMQFTAVGIWRFLNWYFEATIKWKFPKEYRTYFPSWLFSYMPNDGKFLEFGPMSLNDVCVMCPAWFGSIATFFVFLLTWELSASSTAGVFSAFVMSIIPAHIMRSVAGGFDNESIAVSAFCLVFYLWARSIRTPGSWPIGFLCGLSYGYAAAVWGGYIFVNNLVAIHAAFLVVLGKYNFGLYMSYTLWYVVGTYLATLVPPIGMAPLRALEQMPSLLTFLVFQLMQLCELYRNRHIAQGKRLTGLKFAGFRALVFIVAGLVAAGVAYFLYLGGVFMPLGARIRGLFLESVKTGNPLVDSVAEHQPANDQAYDMYLNKARYLAAIGLFFCWHQKTPAKFFAFLYAAVAYHYSLKMSRLVLICGPIVSVLAGFPIGIVADWCFEQLLGLVSLRAPGGPVALEESGKANNNTGKNGKKHASKPKESVEYIRAGGMGSIWRFLWHFFGPMVKPAELSDFVSSKEWFSQKVWYVDRPLRALVAWAILVVAFRESKKPLQEFIEHCDYIAPRMANPKLLFAHRDQQGRTMIIRDYLDGYLWVKKNTPADSRVIAWWDYGYQITGIANRTSVADGNTWNHEHIATLGRILTSNQKRSHNAMKHLADYALVWAGGHGDDLGKSPHLARIGNSVFPDHCGDDDPMCNKFSFFRDGTPTDMMRDSFLFRAVKHNLEKGIFLDSRYWKEVHTTKHGLMRVFKVVNVSKESKQWIADPKNKVCDAPGSWYCVGQYPPALKKLIEKRRNFAQLEDFNQKKGEKSAYTKLIEEQRSGKKNRDDSDL